MAVPVSLSLNIVGKFLAQAAGLFSPDLLRRAAAVGRHAVLISRRSIIGKVVQFYGRGFCKVFTGGVTRNVNHRKVVVGI